MKWQHRAGTRPAGTVSMAPEHLDHPSRRLKTVTVDGFVLERREWLAIHRRQNAILGPYKRIVFVAMPFLVGGILPLVIGGLLWRQLLQLNRWTQGPALGAISLASGLLTGLVMGRFVTGPHVARARRKAMNELGFPICVSCGYDLRGTEPEHGHCPECHAPVTSFKACAETRHDCGGAGGAVRGDQ